MKSAKQFMDELKGNEPLGIVEFISKYVDLEKNDYRFFGICPACGEIVWIDPDEQVAWCEGYVRENLPKKNVYEYALHLIENGVPQR